MKYNTENSPFQICIFSHDYLFLSSQEIKTRSAHLLTKPRQVLGKTKIKCKAPDSLMCFVNKLGFLSKNKSLSAAM